MAQDDGFHPVGPGRDDVDGRAHHFLDTIDVGAGGDRQVVQGRQGPMVDPAVLFDAPAGIDLVDPIGAADEIAQAKAEDAG